MSERDISPGRTQNLWVSTPEDRRKVGSRPALLEGRASDSYHSNQQVIFVFCQGERLRRALALLGRRVVNLRSPHPVHPREILMGRAGGTQPPRSGSVPPST
jgi:hypothetical protein